MLDQQVSKSNGTTKRSLTAELRFELGDSKGDCLKGRGSARESIEMSLTGGGETYICLVV